VHQPGDCAALSESEFFRRLSPEQLHWTEARVRSRCFYPRRRLFSDGEAAEHLWVVERGRVRLLKSSSKGQVTTLEALGPGEMFGLWSTAPNEKYVGSAEGVSEGRVWRLPRSAVEYLVQRDPGLGAEMVQVISARLRDAHERLHSFAYDAAPTRLARALLRAGEAGAAEVTRRVLAEASGTTVETAIRVLRRFEREGLIRGEVGAIHILDSDRLSAIAGQPLASKQS
jgi:CRP-like cAMP-binding protein